MLATVLIWIGWALLTLLAVFLLALCLPYIAAVRARAGEDAGVVAELRLVSARLPAVARFDSRRAKPRERAAPPKDPRTAKPAGRKARRPSARLAMRALAAAPALFFETLGVFRVDRVRIRGRLGLGDPADTGRLFGWVYPVVYALGWGGAAFDVEPVFDRAVIEGEADLRVRLVPILLGVPAARFAWRVLGPGK